MSNDAEQQQVLDWDVEDDADRNRSAGFRPSTKVVPLNSPKMGSKAEEKPSILSRESTNGLQETAMSHAAANDLDMELLLANQETDGFVSLFSFSFSID